MLREVSRFGLCLTSVFWLEGLRYLEFVSNVNSYQKTSKTILDEYFFNSSGLFVLPTEGFLSVARRCVLRSGDIMGVVFEVVRSTVALVLELSYWRLRCLMVKPMFEQQGDRVVLTARC